MDSATAPLTSFVILTRNGLDVTRACVESIAAHTPQPHELVFVDNGSTDGTLDYLRALRDGDGVTVVLIENDANLGFGAGCNQGIAASLGERILLLNNDVVVTSGWLEAMHAALDDDPTLGMVGPRSNRVAGAQIVEECGYDVATCTGLDAWARTWCDQHRAQRSRTNRIIGFCMLVRRAVLDEIGGFDLRFGIGNFEDDDICLRTCVAGWQIAIAHDSFIHHVGSATFTGEKIDYSAAMGEGFARFSQKWHMTPDEFDPATGAYRADTIIARTQFDPKLHRSPMIAAAGDGEIVELGADTRTVTLLVACDRTMPEESQAALAAAVRSIGPDDDVSVVVRIDPRDSDAYVALDVAADAVGDEHLPDIVVLEIRDENDLPALRACTHALAFGRRAAATRSLARDADTAIVELHELGQPLVSAARS
jgi:GT2 family glycosyltransferase/antitoxin (DNA-binding transcriptional repressor) of toxin-antitoxin stability system